MSLPIQLAQSLLDAALADESLHPSTKSLLGFFQFRHLPPPLQEVTCGFASIVAGVVALPGNSPEKTVVLRKLLEARDALIRVVESA